MNHAEIIVLHVTGLALWLWAAAVSYSVLRWDWTSEGLTWTKHERAVNLTWCLLVAPIMLLVATFIGLGHVTVPGCFGDKEKASW